MNKWNRIGSWMTIIGIGMLALLMLLDLGYPNTLFKLLTPLALALIFLSLVFFTAGWFLDFVTQLRAKHYFVAFGILLAGLLVILRFFW
ncbi:MAG: hypothetical protein Q4D77_02660 [Peptostreptococcaceae bacterium]|nr:hypothetical protein [Peptostreptococcaceae bacterium]